MLLLPPLPRMEAETPASLLQQGQAQEAKGTTEALADAVRSYDRAIALLHAHPVEQVRRELAIAWMNCGNARQKQNDSSAVADAVQAYDEAIALLSAITAPEDLALLNSIGAAWMNRGHAFHRTGTPLALGSALNSYDQAIAVLQELPLDAHRSFRLNLAAAWLNRTQTLLTMQPVDATVAHDSAVKALAISAESGRSDPLLAEVALKTYHALCAVLSHQLNLGATAALVTETSDAVDEALALIRHWETHGVRGFRALAVPLYHFGAQFYLAHQPQFLAEFLLESLDPVRNPGAMPEIDELQLIATASLAQAQADAYNRSLHHPTNERLQEIRLGLEEAVVRLNELRSLRHPSPISHTVA